MIDFLISRGFSLRHACRLLEWNRSTFQYQPRPDSNAALREELRAFSDSKRRRGSRKAHNFLTRKGIQASRNRVHRLWKQEHLQVKKRTGKQVKVATRIDRGLIGGVVVRIGDLVIDASVRGRLQQLATQLA